MSQNIALPAAAAIRIKIAFIQSDVGGRYASSGNCQSKNKTRFILKEMLPRFKSKKALDFKVQGQGMV